MTAIAIRSALERDAGAIAALTGQLGYELADADAAARLSRFLERPDQRFLIAEVDGRPVGWVHAAVAEYIETDPFVVIAGLVVDHDYRGQGVGRTLVEQVENWARAAGYTIVRLWSSTARSEAHRFYEHLGYTSVKTQHAFVKRLNGDGDLRAFVPKVEP